MKTVLVVEDEDWVQEGMQKGIKEVFPQNSPIFQFCDNLKEAISLVRSKAFDLVSVDGRFRLAELGTPYTPEAGPALIQELYTLKFPGHVIFYSANHGQVKKLKSFDFHGRPVHAFEKLTSFGGKQWALEVAKLLV